MINPIQHLTTWLTEEHQSGAFNPWHAILATCAEGPMVHARVVALRKIDERGLLFFTQRGTKKVNELIRNPSASLVFWFELMQREVVVEGEVSALTETENQHYWDSYPREAQLRFYSYAPTSTQPIENKAILESKKKQFEQEYSDKVLPISPYYCGFRLKPSTLMFYAYRTDELSDVFKYEQRDGVWEKQRLSP